MSFHVRSVITHKYGVCMEDRQTLPSPSRYLSCVTAKWLGQLYQKIGICTFKPRPGVGMDCMQATTSHPAGFRPTNKSSDRCSSFCLPTLIPSSLRPCRDLTTPQMGIATTAMHRATSASNLCYRTRLPCNQPDPVSTTMLTNLSPATPSKIRRSIPSHLPTNASNNASVFSSSCRASSPSYYPSQHWSHYQ